MKMDLQIWIRRTVGTFLALALLGVPTAALADCPNGVREPTAREKEHFKRVRAQLKETLPAPLPNWSMESIPDRSYTTSCKGTPEGVMQVRVSVTYWYQVHQEEADRNAAEIRRLEAEVEPLQKMRDEILKELDALNKKSGDAMLAAAEAEKEGNRGLATQKYAEHDKHRTQARAMAKRLDEFQRDKLKPLHDRMEELRRTSHRVRVEVASNGFAQLGGKDVLEIVIGTIPEFGTAPAFKVVSVQVKIMGPKALREALAAQFDQTKLKQLLR